MPGFLKTKEAYGGGEEANAEAEGIAESPGAFAEAEISPEPEGATAEAEPEGWSIKSSFW